MSFRPQPKHELLIDGVAYCIAEHPAAPGMPYGQEGRAATVYQLVAGTEQGALKVFKPRFQVPGLVTLADQLAPLAALPGLRVCERRVLTPRRHPALLRQYPDLIYAVLMPWVAGPTWMEVLLDHRALRPEESLALARALAEILAGMEERRLAHCDLSAPNLLLPALTGSAIRNPQSTIELVDVEQMYGPGLDRPDLLPAGSPGYAHRTAPRGLWAANADRFAGGMLLVEMLGWCDARVRAAAWGESYFDPAETQQPCTRYRVLAQALAERWGMAPVELLERVCASETLADCPTLGQWLVALPDAVPARQPLTPRQPAPAPPPPDSGPALPDETVVAAPGSAPLDPQALAALFADGLAAYQQADWRQATELLGAVIRQQPGYQQRRYKAVTLFLDAERRLAAPAPRRAGPVWRVAGAVVVLAGLLFGGLLLNQVVGVATAQNQATAEIPTAFAVAHSQATVTAQAAQTLVSVQDIGTAQAQTTETAQADQALATAPAQSTTTMQAQQGAAPQAQTSTSIAANQATATAQAHEATVRAVGTVLAHETAISLRKQASAVAAQTAQAQGTSLARQIAATTEAKIASTQATQKTATAGAIARRQAATGTAAAQATQTAYALNRVPPTKHPTAVAARITPFPLPQQLSPPNGASVHMGDYLRVSNMGYLGSRVVYDFQIGPNGGGFPRPSPDFHITNDGLTTSSPIFVPGNSYTWRVGIYVYDANDNILGERGWTPEWSFTIAP